MAIRNPIDNSAEGPHVETVRRNVPGTDYYVELRQEVFSDGRLGYHIEHGNKYGRRGAWGRSNYAEAVACFDSAWNWEKRRPAADAMIALGMTEREAYDIVRAERDREAAEVAEAAEVLAAVTGSRAAPEVEPMRAVLIDSDAAMATVEMALDLLCEKARAERDAMVLQQVQGLRLQIALAKLGQGRAAVVPF